MRDDRAVARRGAMLGVALLVTAFFSLDFADSLAKLMTGSVPVIEIVITHGKTHIAHQRRDAMKNGEVRGNQQRHDSDTSNEAFLTG